MPEDLQPSKASEIIADFQGSTKVVRAGNHNYRIKKLNLLEMGVMKVLSLPVFRERETEEAIKNNELIEEAKKYLNDPVNRPEILTSTLITYTVEPTLTEGQSNPEKNMISLSVLDEKEKLELFGKIMDYSGFSLTKSQFFREAAGANRSGPGSNSPEISPAPTSVASPAS